MHEPTHTNPREKNAPAVFSEVSSRSLSITRQRRSSRLDEWEDRILSKFADGMDGYTRMLDDDQVFAALQQRRLALIDRPYEVTPGGAAAPDEKAADWLREQLRHIDLPRIVGLAHYGIYYGISVAEMMYARDGAHIAIDDIRVRDRARFRVTGDWQLRLIDTKEGLAEGVPLPPRKMWVFRSGGTHDDLSYGVGLAHVLYWLVLFRMGVTRDWMSHLERFVGPIPFGKFPGSADKTEQDKLIEALNALRNDAAVAIPEGMIVEFMESKRSSAADYSSLYDRLTKSISKVILSETMTLDDGSSRSQAEVHEGVALSIERADARLVYGSLSAPSGYGEAPLEWMTEWNFPGARVPRIRPVFEEPEDVNILSERDERLVRIGYRPSPARVAETYGEGYEEAQPDARTQAPGPAPVELAENAQPPTAAELYAEAILPEADREIERWIDKVRRLLDESEDLASFGERLLDLYPEITPDSLARVLGDGMAASMMAGRYEVDEGE